ncbi:hypothetical protein ACA910_012743 [Epithemia clementina (nom. ined.)]
MSQREDMVINASDQQNQAPVENPATEIDPASLRHGTGDESSVDSKPTSPQNNETAGASKGPPKLSKNQLKKIRRWERKLEVKKRRKQQEKDAKLARAKAEGRDLEKEREEMLSRAASGEGKRRRQELWNKKMAQASNSFQVCIDCSFENDMTSREINSLAQQLRYCYSTNRRASSPCYLSATSLGGETIKHLQNVSGFEDWSGYGFTCTDASIDVHYKSKLSSVVYLTTDSEHVLESLENDKIYVIGGIVDRNRLKRATLTRAESMGVSTAKLPLDKHLQEMETTKVLTVNHVCEILLKYKELKDWKKALMAVLPDRKKAKFELEESEQL